MRNLLFLFLIWLYPVISFSAIDECKADVYFANGILTSPDSAKKSAELIEKSIIADIFSRSHVARGNAYCNLMLCDNMTYFNTPRFL